MGGEIQRVIQFVQLQFRNPKFPDPSVIFSTQSHHDLRMSWVFGYAIAWKAVGIIYNLRNLWHLEGLGTQIGKNIRTLGRFRPRGPQI